jgi:hypothetical protein
MISSTSSLFMRADGVERLPDARGRGHVLGVAASKSATMCVASNPSFS